MRALSDRLSTVSDVIGPTFWNLAPSFDVTVDCAIDTSHVLYWFGET